MRLGVLLFVTAVIGFSVAAQAADKTKQVKPYPPDAVKSLYAGCTSAKDLPADKVKAVCKCYAVMVQGTVPFAVFNKVNAAMKSKGPDGLDAEGKAAMEMNSFDAQYCRLKHEAAGTAAERATFPDSALPALHESCMNFKDVPDDKKKTFCGCYEGLIRTKVTYADWVLLSLALQTKGPDQLDGDETRTFDAARSAWFACGGGPAAK